MSAVVDLEDSLTNVDNVVSSRPVTCLKDLSVLGETILISSDNQSIVKYCTFKK